MTKSELIKELERYPDDKEFSLQDERKLELVDMDETESRFIGVVARLVPTGKKIITFSRD